MEKRNNESIIEYSLSDNNTSDFCYNSRTGGIIVFSGESKWILPKQTIILKLDHNIHWNDNIYNMLFIPYKYKDLYPLDSMMISGDIIMLYNDRLLPRRIKRGERIGTGYLINKIESHCLELK